MRIVSDSLDKTHRSSVVADCEKKSGWLYGHPVGGEVIVTIRGSAAPLRRIPALSHWFMYSRLNASASARVRSASFIFLSLSVTSSTRAYTKSRIAARTASERLGESSASTRQSSAFRYPAGGRDVNFFQYACRMFSALHLWANR